MDIPRVSTSVRRITVLQPDASGAVSPVVVYERCPTRKKGTRAFRVFEQSARHIADAQARGATSYLARHRKSNEKRKDGWMRDFNLNITRASRKGAKALKLNRLFFF
jgi:hypothetical protein